MDKLMNMLPAEMMIIIPVLNGIGVLIKKALAEKNRSRVQDLICRIVKDTKGIPAVLCAIGMILATIYGLISGIPIIRTDGVVYWLLTSIVWTGLIKGSFVAFMAMGLYDTVKQ